MNKILNFLATAGLACLTGAAALTGATTLATLTGAGALSALPPTRFVLCFLENLKFLKNLASTFFGQN